jgi:hypothetical protein
MSTTTYSDMTAASTLNDEDVFAIDQPSGNVSRKIRLDQVAGYVGNKAVTPAVNAEAARAIGSEGAILIELTQEASRAQSAEDTIADAADAAQASANAANAALPGKANIIPGSHIDWNFHTTPVPAGRTLLFDTAKTPSLSGGSIPTTAAFITIDSDPNKMFGFFTDDGGATTLGGLFHIDGDEVVLDRPVWDGAGWVDNGRYELQYGINPGPMDYIGDSTLTGFDMLTNISVEDIPARDLVDVENELKDSLSDDISENNRHRAFTTRATKELLANISNGFLVRARIDPFDWSVKPYSEWNARTVDPQYVVEAEADLPGTSVADDIAITATGDIYTSDGTDWTKQNSAANTLIDGWLFAETTTNKGWYAFSGEWNQFDFSIDWTQIVDGTTIGYDGVHLFVKGYAEILSGIAGKVDRQQSTADAGKSLMVDETGKVVPGFAGKVDTVNGIPADGNKNVKTQYPYDTYPDYLADRDNVPADALVTIRNDHKDVTAGFMCVPDHENVESINRITVWDGTWTSDRTGFIKCHVSNNQSGYGGTVYINNKQVFYSAGSGIVGDVVVLPVKKGDVVKLTGASTGGWTPGCYFIPPMFVAIPQSRIVVQPGSDEMMAEHPILINDNGVIRQKKDLNGDPIWEQIFTGTINIPAGNGNFNTYQMSGVKNLIHEVIQVKHQSGIDNVNSCFSGWGAVPVAGLLRNRLENSENTLQCVYNSQPTGGISIQYKNIVQYTKV